MAGSFGGIEIGLRALQTARWSTELIGHNIANANTEGYTRQSLSLTAVAPATYPVFNGDREPSIGGGVDVTAVRRFRDSFLDKRYRQAGQESAYWDMISKSQSRIETQVGEPSESGISTQLDQFFAAWHDVANDSVSTGPRSSLIATAQNLASRFNQLGTALSDERANLEDVVVRRVNEVNNYASLIATLNYQISNQQGVSASANDLRDRRDLILDKLSAIVPVTYAESATGNLTVTLDGRNLVSGTNTLALSTQITGGFSNVVWASDNAAVALSSGEIAAAIQQRDIAVPSLQAKVNTLASSLINVVNSQHALGYGLDGVTGRAFFTGTDASTIAVNTVIAADPRTLGAASAASSPGDGSNALLLGKLVDSNAVGGTTTLNGHWNGVIAQVGVDTRQSANLAASYTTVKNSVLTERDALGGVSLDEEAANLIKFQHAYEAAARVISIVDGMLDKIINGMGAGR